MFGSLSSSSTDSHATLPRCTFRRFIEFGRIERPDVAFHVDVTLRHGQCVEPSRFFPRPVKTVKRNEANTPFAHPLHLVREPEFGITDGVMLRLDFSQCGTQVESAGQAAVVVAA